MIYKYEKAIIEYIKKKTDSSDKPVRLAEISDALGVSVDALSRSILSLEKKGAIRVEKKPQIHYEYSEEGSGYVEGGLPEVKLYKMAAERGGNLPIRDLDPSLQRIGIRWAKARGWIRVEDGKIKPVEGKMDEVEQYQHIFSLLPKDESLQATNKDLLTEFIKRGLIEERSRVLQYIYPNNISDALIKELEQGDACPYLTAEMIASGSWKSARFKPLDPKAIPTPPRLAKKHPLERLSDRIKQIFVSLGFQEMTGNYLQPSFWNFDALFQPQDHPARDLADTFYVDADLPLGEDAPVDAVKQAHEKWWKNEWRLERAKEVVLRTHTTVLSAQMLAQAGKKGLKSGKFFSIGRVFRNEATDYKHLAEFHQVEGIIFGPGVNFTNLLGMLSLFYEKLGFDKVRFRPFYFPYTEPSLEIEAYYAPRDEWVEMGGAGIFRPQVSETLAGVYPVLAFGLALERLLLFLTKDEDIRVPYENDIDWLNNVKLRDV